ncbi:hypothetical protein FOJ82_01100 [Tessaracoccus rhinocerotis]|uniref:Uncharacterized protein n=1 Tax=Tessaracoccus rhinocerotis TaxID=1689449 RepID=A0A553K493_9ACTN|nr:hypothetical protein FOJ82_01100 [Tessaracoccus rhinocerotis]
MRVVYVMDEPHRKGFAYGTWCCRHRLSWGLSTRSATPPRTRPFGTPRTIFTQPPRLGGEMVDPPMSRRA